MKQQITRLIWRLIPKSVLSQLVGALAKHPLSKHVIPWYINHFDIDLTPVKKPIEEFPHLLDFFIREYHPEARPIDPKKHVMISPVDGTVSQIGNIEETTLLQVKGLTYQLGQLLGGDESKTKQYSNGRFITIYLSPKDYHRIHMPVSGRIAETTYIPGRLYPVNQIGQQYIPRLFARNERLITYIQTEWGEIGLVKVGATNVGSIKVTFDQEITTNQTSNKQITHKHYQNPHELKKGEELGRFEFGSTVILLFQEHQIEWLIDAKAGTSLKMGEALAGVAD